MHAKCQRDGMALRLPRLMCRCGAVDADGRPSPEGWRRTTSSGPSLEGGRVTRGGARVDLASGYDYRALILASPDGAGAFDPRYGRSDLFNEGLQAQVSIKVMF